MNYLCSCKSEISNVCKVVAGLCLQAIKIVHHYAYICFDWLISGQQRVNPWRESVSILSGKCKDLHLSIMWLKIDFYNNSSDKKLLFSFFSVGKKLDYIKVALHNPYSGSNYFSDIVSSQRNIYSHH